MVQMLTETQYKALKAIYFANRNGMDININRLHYEIKCAYSAAEDIVELLQNLGLIDVIKVGREKKLRITDKGKKVAELLMNVEMLMG